MARFRTLLAAPLAVAIVSSGLGLLPVATSAQAGSHVQPAIDQICQKTMRTKDWTSDYGACTDSLTATAAQISQAIATQQARQTCEAQGVKAGAPAAMCIVNTRRRTTVQPLAIDPSIIQTSVKTYSRMNFKDQHQAEEQSCAALGLQPDGAAFQQCVHALDAALFDADNPQS